MINQVALFLLVFDIFLAVRGEAAVTFVFDCGTGSIGFNDPTEGATRRNALESAATTLGSWFGHTATIQIEAMSNAGGGGASSTLASGRSQFSVVTGVRGYEEGIVRAKILSNGGSDWNGANADGQLEVYF